MDLKFLRNRMTTGLLVLAAGCSSIIPQLKPTTERISITQRYIEGRYKPFKVHRTIPLLSLQEDYSISKNPRIEGYSRLEFTSGETAASRFHIRGDISGNMQSFGLGLNYYPLENLSLNIGTEIFHTHVDINSRFTSLRYSLSDDILGFGLNAGISLETPLTKNIDLFVSGGYNFTDNISSYTSFNFDGAYATIGLKINLP